MDGVTAAILAGGLGTRLRSVVADRPKVLAPVAGRPFLAHLLDRLSSAGVGKVVLLVGYAAEQVKAAFGEEYGGMRLAYSAEPEPRGTGGAVRLALPHFDGDAVLLLNGDSFCDVDLTAFRAFHLEEPRSAALTLTRVPNAGRFGRVNLDTDGRVVGFEEKRANAGPGWINAGVYLLPRRLLEEIPADRAVSLEREVFPDWVARGLVRAFPAGGRFIDIGVPESYAAASEFFA